MSFIKVRNAHKTENTEDYLELIGDMLNKNGDLVKVVKAKDISSVTNLIFRRNSLSGSVECIPDTSSVSLNEELHSHN